MASRDDASDASSASDEGLPMSAFLGGMADGFHPDTGSFEGFGTNQQKAPPAVSALGTTRRVISMASLVDDDLFIDLGCGPGEVVNCIAESVGCRCLGVDCEKRELDRAEEDARKRGIDEGLVRYVQADIKEFASAAKAFAPGVPVSKWVIYVWLIPRQVEAEWMRELLVPLVEQGAKVVFSESFPGGDWPAEHIHGTDGRYKVRLYWRGGGGAGGGAAGAGSGGGGVVAATASGDGVGQGDDRGTGNAGKQ